MGNRPTTAKRTEDAYNDDLFAGVADMQGWRDEMEVWQIDCAVTCIPPLAPQLGKRYFAGRAHIVPSASKQTTSLLVCCF